MIVRMKKLNLLAMLSDREALLHEMMLLGCVEIIQQGDKLLDPQWAEFLSRSKAAERDYKTLHSKATAALGILNKYSPAKSAFFAPRPEVSAGEVFSEDLIYRIENVSLRLEALQNNINTLQSEANRLETTKLSLEPWRSMDLPLDISDTEHVRILIGTLPPAVSSDALREEVSERAEEFEIFPVSSGREQNCIVLICHKDAIGDIMPVLRNRGFSRAAFPGISGTARENIRSIEDKLKEIKASIASEIDGIKAHDKYRDEIKLCIDRLSLELSKKEASDKLLNTERVFCLDGWVTEPEVDKVSRLLSRFTCAYEFMEPLPEEAEKVPIKLKNTKLSEPLTMVTEMYGLPAYDGIDPNPLIMPFFTIFFGIMYGDIGYGLVLLIIGIIAKTRLKPRGTMKYMVGLLIMCGVTSILAGVAFGSFFGDVIPVVTGMLGWEKADIWRLLNPMESPITLLIGSLIIGGVQILVGMGIKAYMLIRDGHPMDALFDIGSWWLLFAGIAVGVLKGFWWVAIAGAAALVLTQGREKPTIIGKLIGGVASLYNITSYFGDILSYSRLMALVLATSVIGSVINLLGSLTGNIITFLIIFIVGHGFSMAINIIGTYVHAARLQYLEYFGKFYKEGGEAFSPLRINTKYVDVK